MKFKYLFAHASCWFFTIMFQLSVGLALFVWLQFNKIDTYIYNPFDESDCCILLRSVLCRGMRCMWQDGLHPPGPTHRHGGRASRVGANTLLGWYSLALGLPPFLVLAAAGPNMELILPIAAAILAFTHLRGCATDFTNSSSLTESTPLSQEYPLHALQYPCYPLQTTVFFLIFYSHVFTANAL